MTLDENQMIFNIEVPEECSMIEQPEKAINFFNKSEKAYRQAIQLVREQKKAAQIVYDLSRSRIFTETSIVILIAHIKDRNINCGLPSTLTFPDNKECAHKLRKAGIHKKVGLSTIDHDDTQVQKISNLQVANDIAKKIVIDSSLFLYKKNVRIKELYSILIELMANTNNHADSKDTAIYPWWLFVFKDEKKGIVKFVFLDLGVGIFESLPVKQYIIKEPLSFLQVKTGSVKRRGEDLTNIFSALISGKIKSSTGLPTRGKGLPLIAKVAKSDQFLSFKIISNDA